MKKPLKVQSKEPATTVKQVTTEFQVKANAPMYGGKDTVEDSLDAALEDFLGAVRFHYLTAERWLIANVKLVRKVDHG